MPWSPEEFLDQAAALQHPFATDASLSDLTKATIFSILTTGPEKTIEKQNKTFEYWSCRAQELESQEQGSERHEA